MNDFRCLRHLILQVGLLVGFPIVQQAPGAPPPGYFLVWHDEFNEEAIDTGKWNYWQLGPRRDAINVTNAISLTCSNLIVTTYTVNSVHYTGMLATDKTFRSRYGYWEARIKRGDTDGMWSAFWFQSRTMGRDLSNPAVSGSEIDDGERNYVDASGKNIANQVQVNIHWKGYGFADRSAGSGNAGSDWARSFHTFGFLCKADAYTFSIDGSPLYHGGSAPVSHRTDWAILSSEADDTSTHWAGYISTDGCGSLAKSTTRLTVDYVGYYAPTKIRSWTGSGDATCLTNSAK